MDKSNLWGSYYLTQNGSTLFISFNESAADKFQKNPGHYNVCAKLEILLNDAEKLPTIVDMSRMNTIEDNFGIFLESNGGLQVGRSTFPGGCTIYGYLPNLQDKHKKFSPDNSYFKSINFKLEKDPNQKIYFDFLWPDEIERNILSDNQVLQALLDQNDSLETPREIFHYLLFNTLYDQKLFKSFALKKGFKIVKKHTQNEDCRHLLIISHKEAPENISGTTTFLVEEVKAFKGDYTGWETQVVKKEMTCC